jgi:hypothetical protein
METKIFLQMALDRANHVDPVQQIANRAQGKGARAMPTKAVMRRFRESVALRL